jgi:uncharacterized protein
MKKVALEIIMLSHSVTQSHSFTVILGEVGGTKRLPIVIGAYEAQSIAVALDNMKPSRPLTHDLMKSVCDTFHLELDHIFICDFVEGIFFSKLVFTQNDETVEIDSRTSDALAMAVRFDCPIFVSEKIMSEAGVDTNEEDELTEEEELIDEQIEELTSSVPPSSPKGSLNFSSYSKEQLEQELTQAIENEDYELAARIRDELNKR